MPDLYAPVTKQNSTERIYKTTLINNTDLQQSQALSELIVAISERGFYSTPLQVQSDVTSGGITLDQYVIADGVAFAPRFRFVDTAANIIKDYL
jgi:ABC-type uncharacterized transport system involved in gliding motility auxiliary subunit